MFVANKAGLILETQNATKVLVLRHVCTLVAIVVGLPNLSSVSQTNIQTTR